MVEEGKGKEKAGGRRRNKKKRRAEGERKRDPFSTD
jgi:hypothetical protein